MEQTPKDFADAIQDLEQSEPEQAGAYQRSERLALAVQQLGEKADELFPDAPDIPQITARYVGGSPSIRLGITRTPEDDGRSYDFHYFDDSKQKMGGPMDCAIPGMNKLDVRLQADGSMVYLDDKGEPKESDNDSTAADSADFLHDLLKFSRDKPLSFVGQVALLWRMRK